jgi:hypothetical protein
MDTDIRHPATWAVEFALVKLSLAAHPHPYQLTPLYNNRKILALS